MRTATFLTALFIFTACSTKSDKDFVDQVLDLTIETSTGENIQLPNLYDKLANEIPDDKDEKLILVERLQNRGFQVTNWQRGNFRPLGPRFVEVELKKGNCICDVSKIYYSTLVDTLYHVVEKIHCKRSFIKK